MPIHPRLSAWSGQCLFLATLIAMVMGNAQPTITSFDADGFMAWSGAPVPGVSTVESAETPQGSWKPRQNRFSITGNDQVSLQAAATTGFYRLRSVGVPATPEGFTNLVNSYGILETIAGTGQGQEDVSYWQSWYEGWPGAWVALSRPHVAMADRAGNVYIADKNSHSILRLAPDGTLRTHAGTHVGGFNGEGPAPATNLQLNLPNGLWVRADGTVYVLDTDNGRVRRVNTNGIMTTLFWANSDATPLGGGRGLWVRDDESLAYFCNNTRLRRWTPSTGVRTHASGFTELGTLYVEPNGDILVCDRGAHCVYRVRPNGTRTVIAGNGTTSGGGDGFPALETGLNGVRSIWPVPTGGYLLLTHDGCQLWYLDTAGIVRLLLNGDRGRTHSGNGSFFYTPEPKISEGRSVAMDYEGNILICESDYGYIRRISFRPESP
jgi:DNA-binding beta-propeller fold protein YncE